MGIPNPITETDYLLWEREQKRRRQEREEELLTLEEQATLEVAVGAILDRIAAGEYEVANGQLYDRTDPANPVVVELPEGFPTELIEGLEQMQETEGPLDESDFSPEQVAAFAEFGIDLSQLATGGQPEEIPIGGGPTVFTTLLGDPSAAPSGGMGFDDLEVTVTPKYMLSQRQPGRNDARDLFLTKSHPYRAAIQARMQAAGWLQEGTYTPGVWGLESVDAMSKFMTVANTTLQPGTNRLMNFEEAITFVADMRADLDVPPRAIYERLPFRRPVDAEVDDFVESMFRSQTGRDPFPDELKELSAFLVEKLRQSHVADQDRAQIEFDKEQVAARRAARGEEPRQPTGRQPSDIDAAPSPELSLQQRIETAFAPLIERREQDPARRESRRNVASLHSALRGMI